MSFFRDFAAAAINPIGAATGLLAGEVFDQNTSGRRQAISERAKREEAEREDRELFEKTDPRQALGSAGAFSTLGETQRRRMRNMQKSLLNSTSTIPSLLGDQ